MEPMRPMMASLPSLQGSWQLCGGPPRPGAPQWLFPVLPAL